MMMLAQLATPQISWMAIAPELVLGVGAAVVLLIDVQWRPKTARSIGAAVAVILAVAFGLTLLQWFRITDIPVSDRLPFGGMIVIDGIGLITRFVLIAVTALAVASGWRLFERLGRRRAEALALVLISAAGFQIMAISVHLMMMFLGLEIGSIALYVLAGITRDRAESDEAAMKYFLLGSVASAIFIYGVALTFAGTGSLTLIGGIGGGIRGFLDANLVLRPGVILIGIALLVIGLTFKVSAVPFHAWAPDVYRAPMPLLQGAPG
jgi:NADH-quinone oxidoreductase subunit N